MHGQIVELTVQCGDQIEQEPFLLFSVTQGAHLQYYPVKLLFEIILTVLTVKTINF